MRHNASCKHAQVRVEERVLRVLGGRVLTWHVRAADGAAAMTTCPAPLATALDAAATLGGDGTLLWACKMAGAAPVPPIVPFAMGSLGFMTPFPADSIPHVLQARCCGTPAGDAGCKRLFQQT